MNWTAEATSYGASLGRRERGVAATEHPGVSLLFVPVGEEARLKQALADAGIDVLGAGHQMTSSGFTTAALVRCTDTAVLVPIVDGHLPA